MIISKTYPGPVNMRIANFSSIALSLNHILKFDTPNVPAIVDELRKYTDLPYGFMFFDHQINLITEVMAELKSIRSACFPYALFLINDSENNLPGLNWSEFDADLIRLESRDPGDIEQTITSYAQKRFVFDKRRLEFTHDNLLPQTVDVVVVGAGVTGLYAANHLMKHNISFCVLEKQEIVGGIWSMYANSTSQVNTSEAGYRLIEKKSRTNRDHSTTREILEDISQLAQGVSDNIYLNAKVDWIEKADGSYRIKLTNDQKETFITSKGVILAINDRVGTPRKIDWPNQQNYQGELVSGISDGAKHVDWKGKKVAIIGMGAFAVENTRTALEGGASHVTVACRRHGTVCPKIIDYLNFASPYDESFKHDKKSNMRNMLLWKKLYDQSGATQPECWMGKVKHDGHTISVSDMWFIGHFLNKINTVTGSITGMDEKGIILDNQHHIDADVVVNCIGFHRNAFNLKEICDYKEMYNSNYLDKDFMYLADANIDDDAFNSFFGSSVLEMAKFYLDVYVYLFNNPRFDGMIKTDGIEAIAIEERSWSHYITGAAALMKNYPEIYEMAQKQVAKRTQNFKEACDLQRYISANKREWIDMHSLLTGRDMKEEECLPYVFQKLTL